VATAVRAWRGNVHRLFKIGVLIKGADGILEIIGGLLFLLLQQSALNTVTVFLTAHELSEDPGDWIANSLRHAVENLSLDTRLFASAYLVIHGLVKVFLVTGLLRGKMWAYPTALAFLGAFVFYQSYRFVHTHSIGLLILTAFDLVVVSLIWLEYRRRIRLKAR
jgi:uncharacterized membrane protein